MGAWLGGGLGRQPARRLLTLPLLVLTRADLEGEDSSSCSVKQVDVRNVKSWLEFTALFEDQAEHEPMLLKGLSEYWPIQNWTLTRLVDTFGDLEVWPRELRFTDPTIAARTEPTSLREFISNTPSSLAMHEAAFSNLTRALVGIYAIPRPFLNHVHTIPVVSITRQGTGVGFHSPAGGFASWVGQVFGSTSFAFLDAKTKLKDKLKDKWPWSVDLDLHSNSREGLTCILEPGDGMFLPRNHAYAMRGEFDSNMLIGWQGETRDSGELSPALTAISNGDSGTLEKAMSKWPETGKMRKEFLLASTYHAMQSGHLAILKLLKRAGANFDEETPNGGTLLHQGAAAGQADAVRFALKDGADPSVKHSKDGSSSVHTAAHYGHSVVVEVMMQKSKNLWSLKDDQGRQPLHWAVSHGHTAVMKVLLKYRAKVSGQDKSKFTPLHWAAEENRKLAVDLLVQHRAAVDARAVSGETPMMRAALRGHVALIGQLLEHRADIEAKRDGGQSVTHVAAFVGHLNVLKALHARGANITPAPITGHYTPEGLAASAGHAKILDFIREVKDKKVDLKAQDSSMKAAVQAGHVQIVRRLLDSELKVGPPEERLLKVAYMATENGHTNVLDFALGGATPSKGSVGNAALLQASGTELLLGAAQHGHVDVVNYLARLDGIDVNARTAIERQGKAKWSDTPLLSATINGHASVVKALLKHKADHSAVNEKEASSLQLAVLGGRVDIVEALITGGSPLFVPPATVNGTQNMTQRQHLHVAAGTGHVAVAKALLGLRADPMSADHFGLVPIFFAAEQGHVSMMKLLVQHRADLWQEVEGKNETNGEVGTATSMGIAGKHGHIPVLKYLLQSYPVASVKTFTEVFGKQHGDEWQKKLEVAVDLQGREVGDAKMREAMANPKSRKNMEEFNKMYAKLSPKERLVVDEDLREKVEQENAKRKFEEDQEKKRKRRLAEL